MNTTPEGRLSRRALILGGGAVAVGTALPAGPAAAATARGGGRALPQIAYVGSRTTRARNARGAGITVWRVDARSGRWTLLQTVRADDGDPTTPDAPGQIPVNPSFLALNREQTRLYSVHGDDTKVSAFAIDRAGRLSLLNTVDTGRRNPVHLAVDPTGRWLVVANLAPPGSVISLPILPDGSLGAVAGALPLPGTPGPHKTQQLGPNPHMVQFDPTGRWLLIPDRGLDRVFTATLDAASGALSLADPGFTQTRELEGPRHAAFHPTRPFAYVVNELRSTVTSYRWDGRTGALSPLQVLPTTPPEMTGDSRAAGIVVSPDGQYLYASNRSGAGDATPGGPAPDTIAVYRIQRSGVLQTVGWVSTDGIRPRFIGLDLTGRRLYAANEVSDTIVGFDLTRNAGRPRPTGVAARTGSPVCIVFRSAR
jgi:6-phosphogluconolactonase